MCQSRVAEEQKRREASEADLRRVQGELQEHRAVAERQAADAEARLADARAAVHTAEQRAAALQKDLADARSATEVRCPPSHSHKSLHVTMMFQATHSIARLGHPTCCDPSYTIHPCQDEMLLSLQIKLL